MRYGYFDDQKKEYIIFNPMTPMSWANYLGTSEYCGIISNNASGYSFYQSPKTGRMLRFRFNSIPMIVPAGIFISAIMRMVITGLLPGNRWGSRWRSIRMSVIMV